MSCRYRFPFLSSFLLFVCFLSMHVSYSVLSYFHCLVAFDLSITNKCICYLLILYYGMVVALGRY